jgi:hypothetical protein
MSCGGSMKKMAIGGTTTKRIIKKSTGGMYGIPQENLGTSGQYGFAKKGGSTGTHKMPNGKTMLNSKMQNGGATKADPYGVSSEKKRYDKSKGNMGPIKVPKKVDPKAPKTKKNEGCFGASCSQMKKGGATKAAKFAALAPPYDKATFADKIVGAKKSAGSKKLPKAQLGAIVKGVSKISKFFGPAAGATGKSSKIIKPAAKAVKKIKNPRMNSNSDYLKWQAKQIAAGAILAIPPSLALTGAANYYKNKDNKNRNAVNKNKVKVNTNKIKVKTKKN